MAAVADDLFWTKNFVFVCGDVHEAFGSGSRSTLSRVISECSTAALAAVEPSKMTMNINALLGCWARRACWLLLH